MLPATPKTMGKSIFDKLGRPRVWGRMLAAAALLSAGTLAVGAMRGDRPNGPEEAAAETMRVPPPAKRVRAIPSGGIFARVAPPAVPGDVVTPAGGAPIIAESQPQPQPRQDDRNRPDWAVLSLDDFDLFPWTRTESRPQGTARAAEEAQYASQSSKSLPSPAGRASGGGAGSTGSGSSGISGTPGAPGTSPAPPSESAAAPLPVTAVPEPATWLAMMLGFGAVGVTLRFRRIATKVSKPTAP